MTDQVSHATSLATKTANRFANSEQNAPKKISARAAMSSLKRDPQGTFFLGSDGVLRSFDGPYEHHVVDAIGLSPTQIKELLDAQPWSQENEDKFRGVDGRKVTDTRALFDPPLDSRPQDHTEESLAKAMEEVAEKNRKLREQMEKDERDGVNVAEKYACGRAVSNHDLSPKVAE
jgi:hypothetical protein